jgi:hypothetical protein
MVKVELITVPGSGTRTVEKFLTQVWDFELFNFPHKDHDMGEKPMVFNSTHFEPDGGAFNRIIGKKDTLVLSTWRDPLRTVIHNVYKGRKHIMTCFHQLQALRAARPVIMIDLRCIPYMEGEGEILRPMSRVKNDDHALRKAYFNQDIEYIDKVIPDYLKALREFDWGDLWTESWWK